MWIWKPTQRQIERTNVWQLMERLGITDREEFLRYSVDHLEEFWGRLVDHIGIEWFRPYDNVLDASRGVEWAQWFTGGQLNIAHNCLDRHADAGKIAIRAEAEDGATRIISFRELQREVNQLANALAALGVQKGDRVALCMPMVPEVVTILYACFKLGAIAVPIFSGFGPSAIAARLSNSGAKVVFTADYLERRGKRIPLKSKVDEASQGAEHIVVLR